MPSCCRLRPRPAVVTSHGRMHIEPGCLPSTWPPPTVAPNHQRAPDLKRRQAMQIELKRIQREVGITFVYVTHDREEALTMSDRIAVTNDGRVEQIGGSPTSEPSPLLDEDPSR
jgi:hypothetical protein